MKPIRLELAGLQSYREKQTVDFEALCSGGVFGIFGPTGSGKSTILDAMTLALYGKVERAPKGTQGIINGAEDRLSVAFTFELGEAGRRARYRVERQYRRSGETSVNVTLCRLVELAPEGERVLADRQTDVDAAVERLIGLNMQDFTRAVVLPQGKFAAFLTLAGKERRQMLQRLFGLERYGDVLAARLAARHDETKLALRETEAEQLGLGEASPEALDEARERLEAARRNAGRLREELAEAERSHERLARRRELDEERRRTERQLAETEAREPEIRGLEQLAASLERAQKALPALKEADEAAAEVLLRQREAQEAAGELSRRREEAAQAAAMLERAQEEASRAETEWLVARDRAEQAKGLERELSEWERKIAEGEPEKRGAEERLRFLEHDLAGARERLEEIRAGQERLRASLEELRPLADASPRKQEAALRKRQVEDARKRAEDARRESDAAEEKERLSKERLRAAALKLSELRHAGRDLADRWAAAERELAAWRHAMRAEADNAARALAGLERDRAARSLAAGLTEGMPCPVCGSTHHPHPASAAPEPEDAAASVWEARRNEAERIGREADAWTERASWQRSRLEERLAELDRSVLPDAPVAADPAAPGDIAQAAGEAAVAAAAPEGAPGAAGPVAGPAEATPPEGLAGGEAGALWQTFAARLESLAEAIDGWIAGTSAALREAAQAEDAAALLKELREDAGRRLTLAEEEFRAMHDAWMKDFADIPYDRAEEEAEAAREAAEQARAVRDGLDAAAAALAETEGRIRELEREQSGLKLRLAELGARLAAAEQNRDALARRLKELTGGVPADEWMRRAEDGRRRTGEALAAARQEHERAAAALREGEMARAAAEERLAAALRQRGRAEERLGQALAENGFASPDEVRALMDRLPEAEALREEIRLFRERQTALRARLARLLEQNPEDPVGEEEWQASLARVEELRRAHEEALAEAAKAERDLEDLAARRARWQELEERRAVLAEELGRITHLQSILRGNAFIDFVAEEQLEQVCRTASERLGFLTRRRYALEVDGSGGFVIRDDANGGLRRPVTSLSGGETFLASLSLALALSAQIQLRGRYPLEFFFLDEGFGTLDGELLDLVVTSLERLHSERLAVGVISHVPELQARLHRRLVVTPAEPGGRGSRITLEVL
ncbi:MAG TPA: AAA family ATPase [Paenibacillaceae bacterium]